jgi:4-diphosphocytidyl-2-C-methyl-D-erythritol kinase
MRGRGERVELLPESAVARLRGQRLLLFKPSFGIATAWAYGQMAACAPSAYLAPEEAEARLVSWLENPCASLANLLFNNMERVAFTKFLALPTLIEKLRAKFGLAVAMSGSGSACFALLGDDAPLPAICACIHDAWGRDVFMAEAKIS